MKTIFKNLLRAIGVMCYFIVLNFAYTRMNLDRLVGDIKVFSGVYLVLGILFLEKAYQEDRGTVAITGIELLVLSNHSLSIMHVITRFQYDFQLYLLTSSYVIAAYYVLKAIIIYTKDRREYLKGLSDISEIVKEEEPIKKEAKKRKIETKEENRQKETKEQEEPKKEKKKKEKITKANIKEKAQVEQKAREKKTTEPKTKKKTKKVGERKTSPKTKAKPKTTSKSLKAKLEKEGKEND